MGVGSGWIFKHGTNIVDGGLKVLFFGLFCYFSSFFTIFSVFFSLAPLLENFWPTPLLMLSLITINFLIIFHSLVSLINLVFITMSYHFLFFQ